MTPEPHIALPAQAVDPRTICLGIPSKTSPDVLMANGLANIIGTGRLANQPLWKYGGSNVAAVRMTIVHEFLKTSCEWLMMLDDDICFTVLDWDLLWEDHGGEWAVCAEYLQKIPNQIVPARWGLGFTRVHRLVFEKLMQLSTEDGQPFVRQGFYCGELMYDFFPQGINSAGEYRQEDHGFWMLVRLAQIPTRYERRTRLGHAGRMVWKYDAAEVDTDDGGGQ
jgi:hypothetical protein